MSDAMDRLIFEGACRHLGIEPESVLSWRVYEDHVALVVDRGSAGCPKYKVPMDVIDRQKVVISSEPPAERQEQPKPKRKSGRTKK